MRAGISNAVFHVVVRQIIVGRAGIAGIKRKLEHLHAREAALAHKLTHGVRHIAQIFGNDFMPAEVPLRTAEQIDARALFPVARLGILAACGDGEILVKAAEVIDARHIVKLVAIPQTAHPPAVAGLLVIVPAVKRIAPELAIRRETIRRAAGHSGGHVITIELEQLRMRPGIRAVHGDIDRDIADDLDAVCVGIGLERAILLAELELQILLELDIKVELAAVVIQRVAPAQADILRPFIPALAAEEILERHEQRIIGKPPAVFADKTLILAVAADIRALIGLAQQRIAHIVELFVIDILRIAAEVAAIAFLAREYALLDQLVQTDEIRVAGEGGKGLIRRIAVAGRAQGQDLPEGLACIPEIIDKVISGLVKAADAVF